MLLPSVMSIGTLISKIGNFIFFPSMVIFLIIEGFFYKQFVTGHGYRIFLHRDDNSTCTYFIEQIWDFWYNFIRTN